MDASIRRNFDKLLAQHLGEAAASICHAHADAHARLEGGLLDLAGIVRRLEAKLDRLAGAAQHRPLASTLQCRPEAGAQGDEGVLQQRWVGSESAGTVDERDAVGRSQRHPNTKSVSDSYSRQGSGGQVARDSSLSKRSLIDIIDKVCAGELPTADSGSGSRLQPAQIASRFSSTWPDSDPGPEQRRASERHTIQVAKEESLTFYHTEGSHGGPMPKGSEGRERRHLRGKLEISSKIHELENLEISPEQQRDMTEVQREDRVLETQKLQEEEGRRETTIAALDMDRKLDLLSESMGRKLERIAYALGIRNLNVVDNSADDAEDRKRLMEKLKTAFDNDRQKRFGKTGTERERWLEYVFGICKPDQRIGKRGSRCCRLFYF